MPVQLPIVQSAAERGSATKTCQDKEGQSEHLSPGKHFHRIRCIREERQSIICLSAKKSTGFQLTLRRNKVDYCLVQTRMSLCRGSRTRRGDCRTDRRIRGLTFRIARPARPEWDGSPFPPESTNAGQQSRGEGRGLSFQSAGNYSPMQTCDGIRRTLAAPPGGLPGDC